jgi:hypothetical protein
MVANDLGERPKAFCQKNAKIPEVGKVNNYPIIISPLVI